MKLNTKEKILACYPHIYTNCIHKMIEASNVHVYVTLKNCGLPIINNKEPGYWD